MKNLYIDISHLAYRNLFSVLPVLKTAGYDILRHMMIKSIMAYVRDFESDRVYICFDTGKSWRKQFSLRYKAQRKDAREKQSVHKGGDVDWGEFFKMISLLKTELKDHFPFYILGINELEADDIIAHLVRTSDQADQNTMITSDGDYIQLLRYPNTRLYDPIKKKFIDSDNPLHDLQIKICIGDKSDNIPAIRPRTGKITAEKLILSGQLDLMLEEKEVDGITPTELVKNYKRNEKLIDLTKTPKTLIKRLEDELERYTIHDAGDLLHYFVKNDLQEHLSKITIYRRVFKRLKEASKSHVQSEF